MPLISVVIPTYNEEKYVGDILNDLVHQTKKVAEIVVSDCRSDDKTVDISKKMNSKIADCSKRTPAAARNVGASLAKGDYLLFIDADMRVPSNFIEEIEKEIEKNNVDLLTPAYKSDGKVFLDKVLIWAVNKTISYNLKLLKQPFVIGGVMLVKKTLHNKSGGFDEHLLARDDVEYVKKLRKYKPKFIFRRDLLVLHSSRRFQEYGTVRSVAAFIIENSFVAKFLGPVLNRLGLGRKYGNF